MAPYPDIKINVAVSQSSESEMEKTTRNGMGSINAAA